MVGRIIQKLCEYQTCAETRPHLFRWRNVTSTHIRLEIGSSVDWPRAEQERMLAETMCTPVPSLLLQQIERVRTRLYTAVYKDHLIYLKVV
jgi:hypothetical protein